MRALYHNPDSAICRCELFLEPPSLVLAAACLYRSGGLQHRHACIGAAARSIGAPVSERRPAASACLYRSGGLQHRHACIGAADFSPQSRQLRQSSCCRNLLRPYGEGRAPARPQLTGTAAILAALVGCAPRARRYGNSTTTLKNRMVGRAVPGEPPTTIALPILQWSGDLKAQGHAIFPLKVHQGLSPGQSSILQITCTDSFTSMSSARIGGSLGIKGSPSLTERMGAAAAYATSST